MAILIPSKNIYEKQNPKVRDNVIERIEVVANEIFINTNNETVLSLPTIDAFSINESYDGYVSIDTNATESGGIKIKNEKFSAGGANWYNQFVDFEFEIPIGTTDVNYIYKNLIIVLTRTYSKSTTMQKSFTDTFTHKNNTRKEFNFTVAVGEPTYNFLGLAPSDLILYLNQSCTYSTEYPFYINTPNKIKGKIAYSVGIDSEQDEDFERVLNTQITFMVKNSINKKEKIVWQGNGTKTFSLGGNNELMQTSNYYQSTDTNAITRAFSDTLTDYGKGKETATIRCSIGDYYEYDSGDKVISIDNSTGKMSFKMYDQVIPMVYGADGKDRPMSLYQDGTPKVFQVLGSKIYYDGAVWQELSLQEVDKSEVL